MARIIPKSLTDRLDFFTTRAADWADDPGAIGLTAAEVAGLQAALDSFREAKSRAEVARMEAEGATLNQNFAIQTLVDLGSRLIGKIRIAARQDPAVYPLASIAVPSPGVRSSIPPPTPADFRAAPRSDGALELSWTSDLARTSFYRLEREITLAGRTTREVLGAVRDGAYTDDNLPVGYTLAQYFLTPVRQGARRPAIEGATCGARFVPGTIGPGGIGGVRSMAVHRSAIAA